MSRLWSRVGRVSSIALLLAGVAGGFYLHAGQKAERQDAQPSTFEAQAVELDLLKDRYNQHAAARASRRAAEADAAAKAAREAKAAATRARKVEAAVIEKALREKVAKAKRAEQAEKVRNAAPPPFTGPVPDSCDEYSGNRRIGCALMIDRGFALDQFPCLDRLWKKESGWNHKAQNRSSGAYGIPQALPGNKMGATGSDWATNPATQIKWGLGYIKGRYGTPCKAWAHSQRVGWY